jgi:hypothetical protein
MTQRSGYVSTAILAVLCSLAAARGEAQAVNDDGTRAAARELAAHGIEAYQAGDYAGASQRLDKAFRLFATPTLGLWSARARMQLGRWVEAAERYREALRMSAAVGDNATQKQAQADAAAELEALSPRIPGLTLELEGAVPNASITLTLDGAAISSEVLGVRLPVNPGTHRIAAVGQDQRADVEVHVTEREHRHVLLPLQSVGYATGPAPVRLAENVEPLPPAPAGATRADTGGASPLKTLAITGLIVGAASVAASGVIALIAEGKCARGKCASTEEQQSYDPLRTTSTVTFWAGAALAVGGGVLLWAAPASTDAQKPLSLRVGPFGVSVAGTL